ncbi:Tre protein [Staphylococcus phage vB_SepM_ phiIPLA-C1C]|uniref:Uncharacterized protein n=5 Tax=Sepunavirus TaxID=1980928 RepID=W5RAT0_9CAUD|nr:hypothetical protein [Finegoldia magna]YP_009214612.1 Tre protein [Staphylococcus phage phiIPLA-C1C]YP_009601076.1 hypothetical protein FDH45_gp151 [Staphylococcus phage phiIBB-SEP1]AXF38459.1 hypothetical protein Twillingate_023 [Staphylococcus phage Twillingate]MDU5634579.1 hypothetical protein [Staphylococcus epidermidis]QLF87143.1 Tre protein [Staphylococcus phage vB_SepM_BE05]QLF87343.1 Tre protein [Staphylococcus phage vB_SepM_BE06]QLF87354.1 hypothetical protein BESEP7_00006 [Staph
MTNFKNEFLSNYNFMDIENFNDGKDLYEDKPNTEKEDKLMDEIFDYVINNKLMNLDNETICSVFNNDTTLKIEIHNPDTDKKRYLEI